MNPLSSSTQSDLYNLFCILVSIFCVQAKVLRATESTWILHHLRSNCFLCNSTGSSNKDSSLMNITSGFFSSTRLSFTANKSSNKNSLLACTNTSHLIIFPRLLQAVHAGVFKSETLWLTHSLFGAICSFICQFVSKFGYRWINCSLKVSCNCNIVTSGMVVFFFFLFFSR